MRVHRLLSASSSVVSSLLAGAASRPATDAPASLALDDVQRSAALAGVGSWTSLTTLVGGALPARQILADIAARDRSETVFTLARIAADLANVPGGLFGEEARAWTHDLLKQRVDSTNPMERANLARGDGTPFGERDRPRARDLRPPAFRHHPGDAWSAAPSGWSARVPDARGQRLPPRVAPAAHDAHDRDRGRARLDSPGAASSTALTTRCGSSSGWPASWSAHPRACPRR